MGMLCHNDVCFPSLYHVVRGLEEGRRIMIEHTADVSMELPIPPGCYTLGHTFFKGHLFLVLWCFGLCSHIPTRSYLHCQCQGSAESIGS